MMVTESGIFLFDTDIGRCGIAWTRLGVVRLQLPDVDDEKTKFRLLQRTSTPGSVSPPAEVCDAINKVRAVVAGERTDLMTIKLDMSRLPEFQVSVYEAVRAIPFGATCSYGEIARQLGEPRLAQAVGRALSRNPFAIIVPCHRVLAAGGRPGGFSATGGVATKLRLLAIEGVALGDGPTLFDHFDTPGG